jgi:uncharacterized membrane protein
MAIVYLIIKFIHIFAAIVAVGSNVTYGAWLARVGSEPEHTTFALKGVKFIDDRIANPAYGVVLVTGVIMAIWGFGFFHLWIIVALVLFIVAIILGVVVYTPLLRNQIKLAESGETASPEYVRLSNQGRLIGPAIGLIVAVILVMMVFKPGP